MRLIVCNQRINVGLTYWKYVNCKWTECMIIIIRHNTDDPLSLYLWPDLFTSDLLPPTYSLMYLFLYKWKPTFFHVLVSIEPMTAAHGIHFTAIHLFSIIYKSHMQRIETISKCTMLVMLLSMFCYRCTYREPTVYFNQVPAS